MGHVWGSVTLDAITHTIGFDLFDDGIGRTRLGIAYLVWRLRNSRVLDLPAPVHPAPAR